MLRATAAALLAAVALLTAGCGGSSSPADTSSDPTSDSPAASASATESESESAEPSDAASDQGSGQQIVISVKDGKVTPATHREKVDAGSTVSIRVTSDTSDEIHVHGYDLMRDLEAGRPGTITFVADQTGIFEVELEDEGLQLVQLQVQ